ncbi:helix-turn-helix domain-containing GNAT family N-acetyltransferase [Piscinibacter sp. HJYY11]|uniref:bifunctional helix-turn-helix transcriptional regulator/GNAT family N-acetyltransferase n=1 Tax=Piscinibacter sp. HJYY11 TaxID=2801333 RepID=UPI00191D6AFF|nr:helix-turn-helix domain-containing GNAT family N-acetyltransferase [Piscinibacter sp. HJYY11]MBL0730720.1 MarR family transcriptional regulator [Piscinibacter sp. HJYY11]
MPAADPLESIRAFNRFYTRRIGVLNEGLLGSPYSLAEMRLLWELAHCEHTTATELARTLDLDAGYLSRLLRRLKEQGLVDSTRSPTDARQTRLSLTPAGRTAFAPFDQRSREQAAALIAPLPEAHRQQVLQAMGTLQQLLGDDAPRHGTAPYILRPHRAGDMGWVVSRHGALYAQEYRWDMRFEALVARVAADFIEHFDPARETGWIAERDGQNIGCVFLVQARDDATHDPLPGVAQLRMLLVEHTARGLGLGQRLVHECERFARMAGYRRITLWTNSLLTAARGIYQKAGYQLVASEPHHSFGHDLVGETWQKELT